MDFNGKINILWLKSQHAMRFDMDAKTLQHNQMKQAKTFAILRRSAAVQLLSKHNDVWQGFVLRCAIDDL